MHEEFGRGDSGIATAATVTTWAFNPAIMAGNKSVLDHFAPMFCGDKLKKACFAITEPGGSHGGGVAILKILRCTGVKSGPLPGLKETNG
jgi:alkylation response protein AidB-like acyl-CoA dehydrogenase